MRTGNGQHHKDTREVLHWTGLDCAGKSSTRDSMKGGLAAKKDCAKWTGSVTYSKISRDVRSGPSQWGWMLHENTHPPHKTHTYKQRLSGRNVSPLPVRTIVTERQTLSIEALCFFWCQSRSFLYWMPHFHFFLSVFSSLSTSLVVYLCVLVLLFWACATKHARVQASFPVCLNTSSFEHLVFVRKCFRNYDCTLWFCHVGDLSKEHFKEEFFAPCWYSIKEWQ